MKEFDGILQGLLELKRNLFNAIMRYRGKIRNNGSVGGPLTFAIKGSNMTNDFEVKGNTANFLC